MQNEWKYVMQKFHLETLLYFCPAESVFPNLSLSVRRAPLSASMQTTFHALFIAAHGVSRKTS